MSKNKQMRSKRATAVGPSRRTAGAASLVQGVYGTHGNLEAVACDETDGLWVFWFNADEPGYPSPSPDVPPQTWSAGLAFAAGARYRDAQVLQSTLGPDHLEVLALDDEDVLQSWWWSPGSGFQRRSTDAATGATVFAAEHDDGTVRVTWRSADGTVHHLASTPDGYPVRRWQAVTDGPGLPADDTAARWQAINAGVDAASIAQGSARAAASTRAGGTVELVWRDVDGSLRHLGVPLTVS